MIIIIYTIINNISFPTYSKPCSGLFFSHYAAIVGFGADNENEIGIPDIPVHPEGPAFFRVGFISVDNCINTIRPELVG